MRVSGGFVYSEKHSYRDMNVSIIGDIEITFPHKDKSGKRKIPGSNVTYDFSSLYGNQMFEERTVSMTINIIDFKRLNIVRTQQIASNIINWLMQPLEKERLELDSMPGFYFLAEVESGPEMETDLFEKGEMKIVFTAYPFKIDNNPEGNDIWDTFNFELDVVQNTNFYTERTTFKKLNIGDSATVGAWSTNYDGGEGIPRRFLGNSYSITDIQLTDQHVSKISYYLTGLNKWVIEQDVVQAQNGAIEIDILNVGTADVTPTVVTDKPITIIKEDAIYNIWSGTTKDDLLMLNVGSNKMLVAGNNAKFSFVFHKELI